LLPSSSDEDVEITEVDEDEDPFLVEASRAQLPEIPEPDGRPLSSLLL
jgi:hypothetical protein